MELEGSNKVNVYTQVLVLSCRKQDDINSTDVTVNAIAGSNKKRRKKVPVEVHENSDSEESVHTSDMSTDEEDSGEVTGVGTEQNAEINTSSVIVPCPGVPKDTTGLVRTNNESSVDKLLTDESSNHKQLHVRGTSGNWTVTEMKQKYTCITGTKAKTTGTTDAADVEISASVDTDTVKVEKDKDSMKSDNVIVKKENVTDTENKNVTASGNVNTVKKVVNIPVYREQNIQVSLTILVLLLAFLLFFFSQTVEITLCLWLYQHWRLPAKTLLLAIIYSLMSRLSALLPQVGRVSQRLQDRPTF